MNLRQIRYVLALAEEGSFSKAADALNITQPSLSQYIKKIETEAGMELFDRTGGEVRITDAGKVYVETGRKILDLEHQMQNAFSDLASNKTGSLVIGTSPYRAASMLPAIARTFRELHPGMHLVVREGTTAELAEGLENGKYDLCLTLLPVDRRLFDCAKVAEEEMILAVPGSEPPFPSVELPGRRYPAVRAEILDGKQMVMLTDAQYMQKQLDGLAKEFRLTVRPAAVVKSLEAQISMVRAGVGMALVPTGIERFCAGDEVRFYSFIQPLPKREVVVSWRREIALSKTAVELRDIICGIRW